MSTKQEEKRWTIYSTEITDPSDDEYFNDEFFREMYPDGMTEEQKIRCLIEDNEDELENVKSDFSRLHAENPLLIIETIGRWDGAFRGCTIHRFPSMAMLLDDLYGCVEGEFYCDQHDFRFSGNHHDGSNSCLFRMFKPGMTEQKIDNLIQKYLDGKMTSRDLSRYTVSLRPMIAEMYGWDKPRQAKAKQAETKKAEPAA